MGWFWFINTPCGVITDDPSTPGIDESFTLEIPRTWPAKFTTLIQQIGGSASVVLAADSPDNTPTPAVGSPYYPFSMNGKWQVYDMPDGGQYCFLWATTAGQQIRVAYSKTGAFQYLGGECAEADDEVVLCGGGTASSPSYLQLWNTTTTDMVHLAIQDEAPYGLYVAAWSSSATLTSGAFLIDPIVPSSHPDDDTTAFVGYFDTVGSNVWSPPGVNEGVAERTDGSWFALSALRLADAVGSNHLPHGSGEHPERGWALVPAVWSRRAADGDPWVKGVGSCPWAPDATHSNGARYNTPDGLCFMKIGQVLLPWPTLTDMAAGRVLGNANQLTIVDVDPDGPASTPEFDAYYVYGQAPAVGDAAPVVAFR